jgi:3-deoxy-manno-octulosonate cytidylyltransferase (CMP-KDO synthetase)
MIEHVYRRAAASRAVGLVLVATDDERVRRAVESFGGLAVMTSPAHPSGTDRIAEVAAGLTCDLVVNVQGDEPLLVPEMIDEAVAPFAGDPAVQMSTIRRAITDRGDILNPNVTKVVVDRAGDALYFSRAPIPCDRGPGGPAPARAYKHIGLYVYRRTFLLELARLAPTPLERTEGIEQLRALEHGYRIRTVETAHDSLGVDTADDLERARGLLSAARV